MKDALLATFKKPTLVLILGIPIILVGLPVGLNGLTKSGGASLGGVIILSYVLLVLVILVIDRLAVRRINSLHLSLAELVFGIVFFIFYQYQNKKVLIDLEQYTSDFYVVVQVAKEDKISEMDDGFMFDKKIFIDDYYSIISRDQVDKYSIIVNPPQSWDGMVVRPKNEGDYFVKFYHSRKEDFSEVTIDSLIEKTIESVANPKK